MDLPPGPRLPRSASDDRLVDAPGLLPGGRARYGKRFTVRLLQTPPFVMLSEPDHLREVFTAPPEVLHPGEGAASSSR